jgi:hypothetical protein
MIRLTDDQKLIRRFYGFKSTFSKPCRLSTEELERKISELRDDPVVYSLRNTKTGETLKLRKVKWCMTVGRSSSTLVLLSDGALKEMTGNYNYSGNVVGQYLSEEETSTFYNIKCELYDNEEMVVSDMGFRFLTMEQREETFMDAVSKCLAWSVMISSPSMGDRETFNCLMREIRPSFFDKSLLDNDVPLITKVETPPTYIHFYNGRSRENRETGVLDSLIYSSVYYHVSNNFTFEEIRQMEYGQLLRDARMRLTIREMIINWMNDGGERCS